MSRLKLFHATYGTLVANQKQLPRCLLQAVWMTRLEFNKACRRGYHLLQVQEWIGIRPYWLNPSFIVWKNLIWIDSFRHLKGYIVPHSICMKIQIWKFENNLGLATFYGYLFKNMSCDLFWVTYISKKIKSTSVCQIGPLLMTDIDNVTFDSYINPSCQFFQALFFSFF